MRDVVNSDGSIITPTEMCKMHNLAINLFDYHRVELMTKSFHVRTIFQSPNGNKNFYRILVQYNLMSLYVKKYDPKN